MPRGKAEHAEVIIPKLREAVEHVRGVFGRDRVSERRACRVIRQSRSTRRRVRWVPDDEFRLVKRIEWLACDRRGLEAHER
jgi:hypothetical protein